MNDRFRFKVYDKVAKKLSDSFALFGEFTLLGAVHSWQREIRDDDKPCLEMLNDLIIIQCTALRDKHGKLMFEGDRIKFNYWWFDGNETSSELTGEIVYSAESMSFQLKGVKNKEWEEFTGYKNDTEYLTPFSELRFEEDDFEIIGNIYEGDNT